MIQPAALALHPTADLTAFYYSSAPVFALAVERGDWATVRHLDAIEADLMARDAAADQFDPAGDVSDLYVVSESDDRDWCASHDADVAA